MRVSRAKGWAAVALLIVAAAALASATPAPAKGRGGSSLPLRFFGVAPETPLGAADFKRMQGTVGTVRLPFSWAALEPKPGSYEFGRLDAEVREAAAHGIVVLPVVFGTPAWLSSDPVRPPLASRRARRAWASFLRTLVGRYGPGGTVWRGVRRRRPIHSWQIWNEPNFRLFWHPHPAPRRYARLLAISGSALRRADRRARIVGAGVAPVRAGIAPWYFLRRLYRVPGVKRNLDVVALHPYAARVSLMKEEVRAVRTVLDRAGARRTPLLISEIGVASWSSFPSAFARGEAGQARFLKKAYRWLTARRRSLRIAGVDWFTWRDVERPDRHCSFCQGAGLIDREGRAKPAWRAYRRAVERARGPAGNAKFPKRSEAFRAGGVGPSVELVIASSEGGA